MTQATSQFTDAPRTADRNRAVRSAVDTSRTRAPRGLRLRTLVRLRWLAVIGQAVTLTLVSGLLDFAVPLVPALTLVAASVALNCYLIARHPHEMQLTPGAAAMSLGFDVVQLAGLLALTGGLENPFAVLLVAPVIVSASMLPMRETLILGAGACVLATILALWHLPLPWYEPNGVDLPQLYVFGLWLGILSMLGFCGIYAWRAADEAQQLSDALTATELVLAQEKYLSDLDGMAAAAAHELGTPLSTIALVVREMQRELPDGVSQEDITLLAEQTERCRTILRKIGSLGDDEGTPFARQSISELIEEAAAPHRDFGIDIAIERLGETAEEPRWRRSPAILHGLGNLIENAVDFARTRVRIVSEWDDETVRVTVRDDGRGIPVDILPRLGQPYLIGRAGRNDPVQAIDRKGLGLGVFIAKTLLERTGAVIDIRNASEPGNGAVISVRWQRTDLDAALSPME